MISRSALRAVGVVLCATLAALALARWLGVRSFLDEAVRAQGVVVALVDVELGGSPLERARDRFPRVRFPAEGDEPVHFRADVPARRLDVDEGDAVEVAYLASDPSATARVVGPHMVRGAQLLGLLALAALVAPVLAARPFELMRRRASPPSTPR